LQRRELSTRSARAWLVVVCIQRFPHAETVLGRSRQVGARLRQVGSDPARRGQTPNGGCDNSVAVLELDERART